jgi:hypothetical protein
MSRLDDHVSAVRNRLALRLFVVALGWSSAIYALLVLLAVLADRVFLLRLPQPMLWLYSGAAAAVVAALGYALHKRPDEHEAAIPIDQKLGLKEKISTALYIRTNKDPFAQAALRDAEETARIVVVNMRQHFPLSFPRPVFATAALVIAAMLSSKLDPMNFFDRRATEDKRVAQQASVEQAHKTVERALASVSAMPPTVADQEAIRLAKAELQAMLAQPITDPAKATRTANRSLQDVNEAIKDQIKSSAKFAEAQNEAKMFRSMQKPVEGQGPVADAHRAIAEGKFTEAIEDLEKAIDNFEKMDKADQQKAAQQMQQMAQQLQQMGQNNPQQQKQMQQQLQQMGMNQQQAQQAQQLMQQAAQGNQQAQQQLQQMAQQAMAQANPQQQQAMQQMMQQMQAQANGQQQAQQMAQGAQQMAQAMQQAAQQQGQPQGGQQQNQQQQNQAMGQAGQQMQQQLQQMAAAAQDAQQIAAAQAAAQAAQAQAQQAMNGNAPANNPGPQGAGGANWNPNANMQGNQNQQWGGEKNFAGPNQGGQAAGDRNYKDQAPFSVKQEISPSQDDEKGRILASNYIKDNNPIRGNSTESLKQVADRAQTEQTDEIDQERISRQAQHAVREYFKSMSTDGN